MLDDYVLKVLCKATRFNYGIFKTAAAAPAALADARANFGYFLRNRGPCRLRARQVDSGLNSRSAYHRGFRDAWPRFSLSLVPL